MSEKERCLQLINDDNYVILDFKIKNFYAQSYDIKIFVFVKNKEYYTNEYFDIKDKDTLMYLLSELIDYCNSHIEEREKYWE